jgi:hypothetical protein
MQDKRSEPRQRTVMQGEIVSGNGLTMNCAVRDISKRGARVSLITPFHVTDRLVLRIPSRRMLVTARVRWRKGGHIGLVFTSVAELPSFGTALDQIA